MSDRRPIQPKPAVQDAGDLPLGELMALYYEAYLAEFDGDENKASVAAAEAVNRDLAEHARGAMGDVSDNN